MKAAPRWIVDAGTNNFSNCREPHEHVATCPGCAGRQKDHRIEVEAETATAALLRGVEMLSRIVPPGTVVVCAHVEGNVKLPYPAGRSMPTRIDSFMP
jgi:hypothetical protein